MTYPNGGTGERILVVDDEADIVALVAYHLVKSGYRVSTAPSGADALLAARQERPALIVLDLMLPGASGYEVLEQLRANNATKEIAVLMLTARRDEQDRIRGLALGADDYLTKPFNPQELVLRVGAILRRISAGGGTASDVLVIGPMTIDRAEHRVVVDHDEIELTPTEYKLLLTLAERRGRVQGRAHLLEMVWEAAPDIQTRTVDMHVQRLRAKLGSAGDLIETVRGFGYRVRGGQIPEHVRLTQRLLAGSLILISVLIAGVVVIAGSRLRTRLEFEMRADLLREAQAVGVAWSADRGDPEVLADSLGAALGRRVTLIDSNGVVVGDADFSGAALRALQNHSGRPEIVDARRTGSGCSLRPSPSAGDEEMYCAVRHPFGFARVSIATSSFLGIVNDAQQQVLAAGLIALMAAIVLAWIFSRSVSRPIIELREVARAIAAGDLTRRPALSAPGEVGDLAVALHRMAEQLGARLHAIEQEEALMLALIESLDEGILAVSPRGDVVRLNPSARRLLDIRAATPFPADQLPPDRSLREALQGAMAGREPEGAETTIHDQTLALTARPLPSGGAVLAVMDLTARRRLETIRRDFVANVSHELKTPLTVIAGFAQTIADPDLSREQRDLFIGTILANTTRMQRIVDDLLDLSRYESRGWTPNVTAVDVESVVHEVFAGTRATATAKGVALASEIAPHADLIAADQTAVRQVVTNLVENAVRYTSNGTVRVRAALADDGASVWIEVHDTGSGIPSDHLPRIFERFYRVDSGRSRDAGGTGLGLAIVRHLVEAHGGRVRAESTLGKGTTIAVSFPAAPIPDASETVV